VQIHQQKLQNIIAMMSHTPFLSFFLLALFVSLVLAQPAPKQQQRISAAIKGASHNSTIDWTQFVNPFIGERL